jgi:hypothetical protein
MKRVTLVLASLLAAVGCANPTGPRDAAKVARAANAKSQLEGASREPTSPSGSSGRIVIN